MTSFWKLFYHILSLINDGKRLLTDLGRKSRNSDTIDVEMEKLYIRG